MGALPWAHATGWDIVKGDRVRLIQVSLYYCVLKLNNLNLTFKKKTIYLLTTSVILPLRFLKPC